MKKACEGCGVKTSKPRPLYMSLGKIIGWLCRHCERRWQEEGFLWRKR